MFNNEQEEEHKLRFIAQLIYGLMTGIGILSIVIALGYYGCWRLRHDSAATRQVSKTVTR